MELLIKNKIDTDNPRNDNSDKRPLFPSGKFQIAREQREAWSCIQDDAISRNISYQMQYLEFQIQLYNNYQMYLTLESLHLKNIVSTISGIVEAALYALVRQANDTAGFTFDTRRSFIDLIADAYDMKIIDRQLSDVFHRLRQDRNLVHFSDLKYREYNAYTVEEVNEYINALQRFIEMQNEQNKG